MYKKNQCGCNSMPSKKNLEFSKTDSREVLVKDVVVFNPPLNQNKLFLDAIERINSFGAVYKFNKGDK